MSGIDSPCSRGSWGSVFGSEAAGEMLGSGPENTATVPSRTSKASVLPEHTCEGCFRMRRKEEWVGNARFIYLEGRLVRHDAWTGAKFGRGCSTLSVKVSLGLTSGYHRVHSSQGQGAKPGRTNIFDSSVCGSTCAMDQSYHYLRSSHPPFLASRSRRKAARNPGYPNQLPQPPSCVPAPCLMSS